MIAKIKSASNIGYCHPEDKTQRTSTGTLFFLWQIKALLIFLLHGIYSLLFTSQVFAQGSSEGLGCGGGFGPIAEALCGVASEEVVGQRLNILLSGIIGFMTLVAGLWFVFQLIRAGYRWIGAGGDKQAVEDAISGIRNALLGLIVVVSAWILAGLVGKMLGFDILNPGQLIIDLGK